MSESIRTEFCLEGREMLHHQRCQKSIFTEGEQVLFMKRIDVRFRVLLDDAIGNDDGPALVGSSDAVERETTGQTGDGAKQTLEGLAQMMGDIVLVNLDHSPPGAFLVFKFGFTADTDDTRVISAGGNKTVNRVGGDRLKSTQQRRHSMVL